MESKQRLRGDSALKQLEQAVPRAFAFRASAGLGYFPRAITNIADVLIRLT